jgi:hypothetical protein
VTTFVESVLLRRADEQTRTVRLTGYWERDSWDVPRAPAPKPTTRARCLAGDCAARVTANGYCRKHWGRVLLGTPVDWDDMRFGSVKPRARREGTGT